MPCSKSLTFFALIFLIPVTTVSGVGAGGTGARNGSVLARCNADADAKQLAGAARDTSVRDCFRKSCFGCVLGMETFRR
jgi:hypothetical protein